MKILDRFSRAAASEAPTDVSAIPALPLGSVSWRVQKNLSQLFLEANNETKARG